jgi:hypothetical protein
METAGKIFLGLVVTLVSLLVISLIDTIEPGWSAGFRNGVDWLYIKFWVVLVFGSGMAGIGYIIWTLSRNPEVQEWLRENAGEIVWFAKTHKKVILLSIAGILGITGIILAIFLYF